jgi:hypothetical protein
LNQDGHCSAPIRRLDAVFQKAAAVDQFSLQSPLAVSAKALS